MAQGIFFELGIVIALAALASIFMKLIRQPLIIGYILTGIIAGPLFLNLAQSDTFIAFSQIGIALLLFIVGLNLNFKTLKQVGAVSLLTAIGQVLFTFIISYAISALLGFSPMNSLYIGIALTFSSTIIAVKILSDRHDMESLHGKITVGFLLVQDFVAIIILMFLSPTFESSSFTSLAVFTLIKVVGIIIALLLVSNYLLPRVLHFAAKSQELLFLFGVSWVLALSAALGRIGFSMEIGALFAGISLASSPFHLEIGSKLKPLRDFFIILFFVSLGSKMIFAAGSNTLLKIISLSAIVLVAKPLIIMFIMGIMGFRKRIGFMTGLAIAQVSEFSLILLLLGMGLGHLSQETVSIVTVVSLITIAGSTYMVMYSEKLYSIFSRQLGIFEKKSLRESESMKRENFKIILFGYNRIGYSLVKSFKKLKKKFLIVDYNPEIISLLEKEMVPYKYGDASDAELLDEMSMHKVELVISTIPQLETNLLLIRKIRNAGSRTIVIMTSHQIDEAFKLYRAGADYVIMPHFLGGEHASALIEKFGTDISKFIREKIRHLHELSHRKSFGHEHPTHH